jgi:VWFA-related protein
MAVILIIANDPGRFDTRRAGALYWAEMPFTPTRLRPAILALMLLPGAAAPLPAQEFSETVTVNYVLIPVNVTDAKGRWVAGLKKDNFELLVSLRPVRVEHFSRDASDPLSTLVIVDASGSMGTGTLPEQTVFALDRLRERIKPGDETALSMFQSRSFRLLRPLGDGPFDPAALLEGIKPWGKTALYDELAYIPVYLREAKHKKRQAILITDTHDNFSEQEPQKVIDSLLQVQVPVHTLALRQTPMEVLDIEFLKILARYSGGAVEVAGTPEEIDAALERIFDRIHHSYLLGFSPGKGMVQYHSVLVSVKGKGKVKVSAKKGYWGGPPKFLR